MSATHMSGPVYTNDPNWRNSEVPKQHIVGGVDTPGGLLAFLNPENSNILITAVTLNITTPSTSACSLVAGTAANGTTSSNNLLDTVSVATAGVKNLIDDKGTNGKTRQLLLTGQYLTFSTVSGASAGLVMDAYIEYIVV